MPPRNRSTRRRKPRATKPAKPAKKTNFDVALEAIRAELKRDYVLYEEALSGVMQAKAAGGDATPWLNQMSDLVRGKPFAAISHEGVKFLVEEMVRKFVADGYQVPQPALMVVR
ncbi:hypothetical protein P171DRAFT_488212 [Karstenula rhodostoma CBS 690.94]|uniref:Uncharacterized protein n=1 Tax=Karstenula rhodostoma CBS 690.94 TaxID=1392251 RepID=A0A9P4U999_9PLEO|nr:hypothetical protein P171DRAFT_488212 [Karstenula rhodostoma CBS 690.94]